MADKNEPTLERRISKERRSGIDRRVANIVVDVERRSGWGRRGKHDRREELGTHATW